VFGRLTIFVLIESCGMYANKNYMQTVSPLFLQLRQKTDLFSASRFTEWNSTAATFRHNNDCCHKRGRRRF